MEILAQGFVFHLVPADAHTQAHAAAAEHVHLGGLLRHQCRLSLRQDDHAGGELDAPGEAGQVAKEYERFVKRVLVGVAVPAGAVGRARAQHMVIGQQMGVAQALGGLGIIADHQGIVADLQLRENRACQHYASSSAGCRGV